MEMPEIKEVEEISTPEPSSKNTVKQEQVHDLLFSREIGWQEIIYDLINTEQLDPWDINLTILTEKFLEKIRILEEADFFVSSKVLLAASLLLRIKSEILLNRYIKSIDDILFGKKESKYHSLERIELNEEIPELIPRSPMPRFRRVTIKELMESLNKAITTENRRIKRAIVNTNALREASLSLPKRNFSIKNKIKEILDRLTGHFNENKDHTKVSYTVFVGMDKEERILSFSPLLHLETQQKVWLEQQEHFGEIDIWMKKTYLQHKGDPFADLKEELKKEMENLSEEETERMEEVNEGFENPLGEFAE